jgi:hypothetical protein
MPKTKPQTVPWPESVELPLDCFNTLRVGFRRLHPAEVVAFMKPSCEVKPAQVTIQ